MLAQLQQSNTQNVQIINTMNNQMESFKEFRQQQANKPHEVKNRNFIDHKTFNNMPKFSGATDKFHEWNRRLKN